jgi:serine/threonine protein kinase
MARALQTYARMSYSGLPTFAPSPEAEVSLADVSIECLSVETPASKASPEPELPFGTQLGRFVVVGCLGRGGMGAVYRCHDPELDRQLAVKVVRAMGGQDKPGARLRREAQAMAKLSHPNVATVYDVGTFRDSLFIAMELIEGVSLSAWLRAQPRTWREIVHVFSEAAKGLAAAHAANLVHRDFKPGNVMVTPQGRVCVMDFGLACAEGRNDPSTPPPLPGSERALKAAAEQQSANLLSSTLTENGLVNGTPRYMAPEQFTFGAVDGAADQYSFCLALFEALFNQRPFDEAVTTTSVPRVPRFPRGSPVPKAVRRALVKGLAVKAADRHASIEVLRQTLIENAYRDRGAQVRQALAMASIFGAALVGAFGFGGR